MTAMRSIITYAVLVIVTAMWCFHTSYATPALPATDKSVEPYIYVSGGVVVPGRYYWFEGMTVLDAVHDAGGFTNFISGRIRISHVDGVTESWKYRQPATMDDTNKPPVLRRGDNIYVPKRIF